MRPKLFTLFMFSIFALVLLSAGLVSASHSTILTISDLNAPANIDIDEGSFNFTFNVTYTGPSDSMTISFSDSTINTGMLSIPDATGMNGSADESRIITGTVSDFSSANVGEIINVLINATTTGGSVDDHTSFSTEITTDKPQEIISCSDIGNPSKLEIKSIDFDNKGMQFNTFGEDDEWFLFEEIEAQIEVENNGDFDVADVEVSWGLWNTQTQEWVIDFDDEDEFDIDENNEESIIITFRIDDDMDVDMDELTDGRDYKLYVTAQGTIDDSNAGTLDDEPTCAFNEDDEGEASVIIEDDFVVLNNFIFPGPAQCGENIEIRGDVWNIGSDAQDEVSLLVINSEFGIREEIQIGDIDEFESEQFLFRFEVPNDAEERFYPLRFEVYDEDFDIYENDFDDEESVFVVPLDVENCGITPSDISVSASLISGGKAGGDLVVRATILNQASESKTYTLGASGYSSWADSVDIDAPAVFLSPGQSQEALFTFDVRSDATGTQEFTIDVSSDVGGSLMSQPVSVIIEPRGFLGITGLVTGDGENAYLWGLAILNVILVAVIIFVAVRIARRRRAA